MPTASIPATARLPWHGSCATCRENGFRGVISLELFNRDYWKQDAATVVRTGLAKNAQPWCEPVCKRRGRSSVTTVTRN